MTALIIEDDVFIYKHLSGILESQDCVSHPRVESLNDFNKIKDDWEFDFAFVDIKLNGENEGIAIALQLKIRQIPFFFVTANSDTVTLLDAADAQPLGYICKPFLEREIIANITVVKARVNSKNSYIEVGSKKRRIQLPFVQIKYILASNVYIEIHAETGMFLERMSLKKFDELSPPNFTRVNKSAIVNNDFVTGKGKKSLFIDDLEIPVSKNFS
jgi:DNA-binding LytR/AlgR family response regulator